MRQWEGSSLGLPTVKELTCGERRSGNDQYPPESVGCFVQPALHMCFMQCSGCWCLGPEQVYEIKAQCPINNWAAYCKKKKCTQYNSYYCQQSDVYRYFKWTSLSSVRFHLMWSPKQIRRRKRTSPPSSMYILSLRWGWWERNLFNVLITQGFAGYPSAFPTHLLYFCFIPSSQLLFICVWRIWNLH